MERDGGDATPILRRAAARSVPPYFNLGVLAGSSETIGRLGTIIFDDLATVNRFCRAVHKCQIALTLAMVRAAAHPAEMGLRFNFPNFPSYWDEYPDEAADIRILHYMHSKEVDRNVFRASPERLRDFLQREELSPVNSFLQARVAELGDIALGIARPSRHTGPRLRFVRPLVPGPEKWVPFLGPPTPPGGSPTTGLLSSGSSGSCRSGAGSRNGMSPWSRARPPAWSQP